MCFYILNYQVDWTKNKKMNIVTCIIIESNRLIVWTRIELNNKNLAYLNLKNIIWTLVQNRIEPDSNNYFCFYLYS